MAESREFKVKISGDASDLKSNVSSALEKLNAVSGGIAGTIAGGLERAIVSPLGAVVAALSSVVFLLREAVSNARSIADISARTNLSPRQAAALRSGAGETGFDAGSVGAILNRFRRVKAEATVDPEGKMAESFKSLGMSIDEVSKTSGFNLFLKFLDKLKEGGLNAEQTAAAMRMTRGQLGEVQLMARRGLGESIRGSLDSSLALTDEQIAQGENIAKDIQKFKSQIGDVKEKFSANLLQFLLTTTERALLVTQAAFMPKGARADFLKLGMAAMTAPGPIKAGMIGGKTSEELEREEDARVEEDARRSKAKREEIKALEERAAMLEGGKGLKDIEPDKFARMGLFLTSGTEKLSNELVGLNKQSVAELKAIKDKLEALKNSNSNPLGDF